MPATAALPRPDLDKYQKSDKSIGARPTRVTGRAAAGGLLIAAAVVVTFVTYTHGGPSQRYVVAAQPLVPGDVLTLGNLMVIDGNLPAAARRVTFSNEVQVADSTVLAPIPAGGLIESGLVARSGPAGAVDVSVSLDRGRAVGGTLRPGELVDVLGTFGSGASSYTAVLAARVPVLAVTANDDGTQDILLAAADEGAAEAVADAGAAVAVSLARVPPNPTQANPGPPPPPYQAPAP